MSASIWPTFASGADPGEHGHYFPFQWDAERMRFERTYETEFERRLDFEPFWHTQSRRGVKTIAFDAGISLNAARSPCLEITNWSYQSSGKATASDPAMLRELQRRFGVRPIGKEVPVPKDGRQSNKLRDQTILALGRKTDATLWLMQQADWQLFVVGFYEIHRAGHNLLAVDGDFGSDADPDALLDVYKAQDRALGKLLDKVKDGRTTVALFALHGMAQNKAQDHFLAELLRRLNAAYRVECGAAPRPRPAPNLMAQLRAKVPFTMQYALANMLGERVQDWVVNRTLTGGLDWSETPSFHMATGGESFIRFNIKGRERDSYFNDDAELSRYRAWLEARLLEIRVADSDEPFVDTVADGAALFPGPRASYLPDLIVTFTQDKPVHTITSPVIGEITASLQTGRGGNHTGNAFLIVTGPGARGAAAGDVSDIRDLAGFADRLLTQTTDRAKSAANPTFA
jgi:predicted AlkP superfamily phosphohydrolase/phosphomutase